MPYVGGCVARVVKEKLKPSRALAMAVSAVAVGAACPPARATNYQWAVTSGDWNVSSDWSPNGQPQSGDSAYIDFLSNATCDVISVVNPVTDVIIDNGDTLSLQHATQADGQVTLSSTMDVGVGTSPGTLNVLGSPPRQETGVGVVDETGSSSAMNVATAGFVNQTGGEVTIGSTANSNSSLQLAGTYDLSAGSLNAGFATIDGGALNLSGSGIATVGGLNVFSVSGGNGAVVQTGGTMDIGSLGGQGGGCLVSSSYSLQGGTLSCPAMSISDTNNTVGTFTYQGGTLTTGTLSLSDGGQMKLTSGGGKVLRTTTVGIGTNSGGAFDGGIDLTNNAMIVDYTGASPLTSIATLIHNGTYNGITQQATGIVSSTAIISGGSAHPTALGFGEASTLGTSTFEGVGVDSTAVLIRYTYVGDANLDGVVNALDFNLLASNFGSAGKQWTQGDFNSDGIVNTLDFNMLANNFDQALAAPPLLSTDVPEPAALPLLALFLIRRTRKSARKNSGK